MDSDLMNRFYNTVQMTIFDQIKTTNPIVNTIVTTLLISLFGSFLSYFNHCEKINIQEIWYNLVHLYREPNKIKICGKNCTNPTMFGDLYISAAYSEGFNAMLDYIIKNIETTPNIIEIKELYSNNTNTNREALSQFIVSQTKEFFIDPDIFINIINSKEDCEAKKTSFQIENISIEIFSYKYSLSELKKYFDKILSNYKISIQTGRNNKKFIYNIEKVFIKEEEGKFDRWKEDEYKSNRTFDNLFFERKDEILKKIDFFMKNKSWYDEMGIPYNLGIGLHGPPGTGKTSFIKALANKTQRDIVIIPLKQIKTVSQLKTIFFEDTYTRLNDSGSKSFDKKIIVFEDIDCIGDIVKNREKLLREKEREKLEKKEEDGCITKEKDKLHTETLSQFLDPITLDDFLNLWDGVRETPGRIIVITSNFYSQLDPALVRPGRIDIGYEMKNVSHKILQEMHVHFFKKEIKDEDILMIETLFYSPAELVNIFLSSDFDESNYLTRLKENRKI